MISCARTSCGKEIASIDDMMSASVHSKSGSAWGLFCSGECAGKDIIEYLAPDAPEESINYMANLWNHIDENMPEETPLASQVDAVAPVTEDTNENVPDGIDGMTIADDSMAWGGNESPPESIPNEPEVEPNVPLAEAPVAVAATAVGVLTGAPDAEGEVEMDATELENLLSNSANQVVSLITSNLSDFVLQQNTERAEELCGVNVDDYVRSALLATSSDLGVLVGITPESVIHIVMQKGGDYSIAWDPTQIDGSFENIQAYLLQRIGQGLQELAPLNQVAQIATTAITPF